MSATTERLAAALADRYRIERELGQGGMATVYLAEDIRHKRRVALKVLKPELAAVLGAERFVQEITTTAALQHPHILALFDSGTVDGFLYYVMPFIDGETLRSKLDRETQLGIDEAIRIASDVASALHYAHTHGVIHRDIKPENILLHDGRPMVADFGIALAVSAAAGGRMTETGLSLGTPHYMSPEQATAEKDISARSDVYSLGSVLYEMLTGNPPHIGASAQQIIMKIITEMPVSVTTLRKSVPANVADAVAKALEKLPADRFASAREFGDALANPAFRSTTEAAAGLERTNSSKWLRDSRTLLTFAIAGAAIVATMFWGRRELSNDSDTDVIRMTVDVDSTLGNMMTNEFTHGRPIVSPDGRSVAFSGMVGDADILLIRTFDQFQLRAVSGGGRHPFYSPDGRRLGFIRGGEIWSVPVHGGDPIPVGRFTTDSWNILGTCWTEDDHILTTTYSGLWVVPSTGGEPKLLIAPDSASGETFNNPISLDEDRVMLEVRVAGRSSRVIVVSLRTGERTMLPELVVPPAAVARDVIIFGRNPVRAVRFDRKTLTLIGAPSPVSGVSMEIGVSPAGSLAWFDNRVQSHEPVWVSSDGKETPLGVAPGLYRWPRLSPNGMLLAHSILESGPEGWLWTTDLRTGKRVRLGVRIGNTEPVWTPDGTHVVFASGEPPQSGLLRRRADASQPADTLYSGPMVPWPTDVSSDGTALAFYASEGNTEHDLHFLKFADKSIRKLSRPGLQRGGRFSPDGRWFAYESTESGSSEVTVEPYPALDAKWVVSSGGGREPVWSRDGRTLFYRNDGRVLAVNVLAGTTWTSSPPREVLRGQWFSDLYGDQSWDIAADGRFLMLRMAAGSRVQVKVIRNWITEFGASRNSPTRGTDAARP